LQDDIFSSAVAAAYYVKHFVNIKDDEKIYVVGGEGICRELEEQGVHWCGCDVSIIIIFFLYKILEIFYVYYIVIIDYKKKFKNLIN